jgi:hypothetical protein
MVTVILQHEVQDYSEWQKFFHGDNEAREKEGVNLLGLYTATDNPNDVTMIFEAPGNETFYEVINLPERQKTLKKAGVISEPKMTFLVKK